MASDFAKAMDDDFNSREAIAKLLAAMREISRMMSELSGDDLAAYAGYCVEWIEEHAGQILGLLKSRAEILAEEEEDPRRAEITEKVEQLLVKRAEVRTAKDWAAADAIRDELTTMGVVVTDTSAGPTWDIL
jgi:cysteinyl-tRNA synthetase